jgi:hypothetical protein
MPLVGSVTTDSPSYISQRKAVGTSGNRVTSPKPLKTLNLDDKRIWTIVVINMHGCVVHSFDAVGKRNIELLKSRLDSLGATTYWRERRCSVKVMLRSEYLETYKPLNNKSQE